MRIYSERTKCLHLWKQCSCLEVNQTNKQKGRVQAHTFACCSIQMQYSFCLAHNAAIAHVKRGGCSSRKLHNVVCGQRKKQTSRYRVQGKTPADTARAAGASYLELRGYKLHGELPCDASDAPSYRMRTFWWAKYRTVQKALFRKVE